MGPPPFPDTFGVCVRGNLRDVWGSRGWGGRVVLHILQMREQWEDEGEMGESLADTSLGDLDP